MLEVSIQAVVLQVHRDDVLHPQNPTLSPERSGLGALVVRRALVSLLALVASTSHHLNVLEADAVSTLGSSRLCTSVNAHYAVQFGIPHFRMR